MSLITTAVCALCAWGLTALLIWTVVQSLRLGVAQLRQLHTIPCDRCIFFTDHPLLKCTVHPSTAFTVAAIDCPDCQRSICPSLNCIPPDPPRIGLYHDC